MDDAEGYLFRFCGRRLRKEKSLIEFRASCYFQLRRFRNFWNAFFDLQ